MQLRARLRLHASLVGLEFEGLQRAPEGGPRQQQAPHAEHRDREEVHDQHGRPRVEPRQQRDGPRAVPAAQPQVIKAGLSKEHSGHEQNIITC